jgi:diaminohydroxyphosphoribosylaminopyrimidine deaminase / 5-amino-6-(5-phosphoribosylamino)uracil reductase
MEHRAIRRTSHVARCDRTRPETRHTLSDSVQRRSLIIRSITSQRESPARPTNAPGIDEACAWTLILNAARLARNAGSTLDDGAVLRAGLAGAPRLFDAGHRPRDGLVWDSNSGWYLGDLACDAPARALFDLYLPFCGPYTGSATVVAHLGQSIDGFIATANGDAHCVTGEANIRHLHRMRALSDAVLVGAETVAADDPRLTTRLVAGPNPVRVLLDPRRRLSADHRVFRDGEAKTLVCCDLARLQAGEGFVGQAKVLGIPAGADGLNLDALLTVLAEHGIQTIFIEGGGATVSRFLQAGRLTRLQIAVAPVVIGSGRPGLRLPSSERMADALRPTTRIFGMGGDVLYDFDLSATPLQAQTARRPREELVRIL